MVTAPATAHPSALTRSSQVQLAPEHSSSLSSGHHLASSSINQLHLSQCDTCVSKARSLRYSTQSNCFISTQVITNLISFFPFDPRAHLQQCCGTLRSCLLRCPLTIGCLVQPAARPSEALTTLRQVDQPPPMLTCPPPPQLLAGPGGLQQVPAVFTALLFPTQLQAAPGRGEPGPSTPLPQATEAPVFLLNCLLHPPPPGQGRVFLLLLPHRLKHQPQHQGVE